jgi:hypothetical protein
MAFIHDWSVQVHIWHMPTNVWFDFRDRTKSAAPYAPAEPGGSRGRATPHPQWKMFITYTKILLYSKKYYIIIFMINIVFFIISTKYICKNIEKLLRHTLCCMCLIFTRCHCIVQLPMIKSSGSAIGPTSNRRVRVKL